jgi:hypothetical protein
MQWHRPPLQRTARSADSAPSMSVMSFFSERADTESFGRDPGSAGALDRGPAGLARGAPESARPV